MYLFCLIRNIHVFVKAIASSQMKQKVKKYMTATTILSYVSVRISFALITL